MYWSTIDQRIQYTQKKISCCPAVLIRRTDESDSNKACVSNARDDILLGESVA